MKSSKNVIFCLVLIVFSFSCSIAIADLNNFENPGNSLSFSDSNFIGENIDNYSGCSVSSAGDIDGDGLSDILIGASGNNDGGFSSGKTYLILGSSISGNGQSMNLANTDYCFIGEYDYDYSGYSISSAGDVDGDGFSDILIGAYGNDDGGFDAGKTYLILGSSIYTDILSGNSSMNLANADYSFIGKNDYVYSSYSIASAGDIDGDGLSDILIGAYKNDDGGSDAGKTYLLLASSILASGPSINLANADYSFIGENNYDCSGRPVASTGDVDGDGLSDIIIGASGNDDGGSNAGKTYLMLGSSIYTDILSGNSSMSLANADYNFIGENSNDYSGHCISSAGDVDGDGLSDILIGAYGNDDRGSYAGKTYLLLGSSILASGPSINLANANYCFKGENTGDYSGYSISSAGNVDGDGFSDILIGARANDDAGSGTGKTYLMLGSSIYTDILSGNSSMNLANADYSFMGENIDDYSGYCVSSAGDVNGDGSSDILIAACYNDDGGSDSGKTYLIYASRKIYVDCYFGDDGIGTGTESNPFETIERGLQEAESFGYRIVIVIGGTYDEVVYLRPNIDLVGELRAGFTFLPPVIRGDGISDYSVDGADGSSIKYCIIRNGGITLNSVNDMVIEENIIHVNANSLYVPIISLYNQSDSNIIKNNIIYNGGADFCAINTILIGGYCDNNEFINNTIHMYRNCNALSLNMAGINMSNNTSNTFRNNIIQIDNPNGASYGFYKVGGAGSQTIEYNLTSPSNYGVIMGIGNIIGDPFFVNPMPNAFDYTLDPALSPCIDTGDPNPMYNDPDGTRNNMGAYGGPNAIDFQ